MILTRKTEKKSQRSKKKRKNFFLILPNFIISFYSLYTHLFIFLYFFHFLELRHNVKNINLKNVILVRESEKAIFCAFFSQMFYKKKVIFFVLRAKVKKSRNWKKVTFFHFPHKAWGYYETACMFGFLCCNFIVLLPCHLIMLFFLQLQKKRN